MSERMGVPPNVVPFPIPRRDLSDIEIVHGSAPSRSLVDTLLAEAGLPARDVSAGVSQDLAYQAWTYERGYGREAAVAVFRTAVDALTGHAARLCRDFNDVAERLVRLERCAAADGGCSMAERMAMAPLRGEFRGRAIAARAAADAAIGAAAALATYVRDGSRAAQEAAGEQRQLALFAAGT